MTAGSIQWIILSIVVSSRGSTASGTCGGIFASEEGIISSPNFPRYYNPNERCIYNIIVPEGYKVFLTFEAFETENHESCRYDYIKIYDSGYTSGTSLGTYCGVSNPGSVWSSGNKITIDFRTDSGVETKGFFAKFEKITCAEHHVSDEALISNFNMLIRKSRNERCIYKIEVPLDYFVLLTFENLELESENNCRHEYIKIYDGGDVNDPSLGTFCGSIYPLPILSSGNEVTIDFRSDQSVPQERGFSVRFEKNRCGGSYKTEEGIISSPNYPRNYGPNQKCIYKITVPEGYLVLLVFQLIQVERHEFCVRDSIKVYDGTNVISPILGNFCGFTIPSPLLSSTNEVIIYFRSDGSNQYRGFSAKFKKVKCGGNFVSEEGTISSPNYPDKYNPNERCVYTITAPESSVVFLTFQDFELEPQVNCLYDSIKIYDGDVRDPSLRTFCGSVNISRIVSSGNQVIIDFSSDESNQYTGFSVKFRREMTCANRTCENGGNCMLDDEYSVFQCRCQHGYQGQLCESKILCTNHTCKNEGICTQDGQNSGFRCACQHGYQGPICEEKIICANETCGNGGICSQDGLDGVIRCTCQHGYQGQICEEKILCTNHTCENGGTCTQDGLNEVIRCTCLHGYQGLICEERILCANDTCANGGICTHDVVDGLIRCECKHGYRGLTCNERILCENDTCKNGAVCIQNSPNEVFRCECGHGYQGLICTERILCRNDTCGNGGSCAQDGTEAVYRCTCQYGYSGVTCEIGSTALPVLYVSIGGALVGAIVLAVIIGIVVRIKSRSVISTNHAEKDYVFELEESYAFK